MLSWYDTIEPEIRPVVRLLRDNGFNTESSCGHKMYVQIGWFAKGALGALHDLLFNNGYESFRIIIHLERNINGLDRCWADLELNPDD